MAAYKIQKTPFVVPTTDGKLIEEHFGKATDGNSGLSIAHMVAPPGWSEPFQTPEFDEFTYIIKKQFSSRSIWRQVYFYHTCGYF